MYVNLSLQTLSEKNTDAELSFNVITELPTEKNMRLSNRQNTQKLK